MNALMRRPTALICEDEALIARDLTGRLEELGFEVIAAVDAGDAALHVVGERQPDVVLMDIHIKGELDGVETATLMRERFDLPVVFVTAWADQQTVARAAASRPYGYIIKPFTNAEVRSAVEIALHRHEADRMLAERERWFSTTLHSISDAVIACDQQQRVRFMNAAAGRLTGWTAADATGRPITEVARVVAENGGHANPVADALRENATKSQPRDVRLVDRDGERSRVIEQSAAPIRHGDELLGAVMVFRDVTEERRLQEQVALTGRLTSLGTLAASVGHEINNPLACNLNNIDFALARLRPLANTAPELDEAIAVLEEARSGGARIADIVASLSSFSGAQEHLHPDVDVRSCVEWALRLTANQLRHAARLVTRFGPVPAVAGNEVRLSQVFVNLLVNASHAIVGSSDDNEISVLTRTDERGRAVIEIHDSGPGMSAATVARLFDRLLTEQPAGVAAGLGLATCRDIVTWMGGELEVTSELGHGACFRVTLPPGAAAVADQPARAEPQCEAGPLRILVIEDDRLLARALARMLAQHHRIEVTDGGEAGLARLAADPAFDLVLCDMMMPQTSGVDVYEQLRARDPALARRMIFMTGGAFTPRAAEFLAAVPNPTIGKPFTRDELLRVLQARHAELVAGAAESG